MRHLLIALVFFAAALSLWERSADGAWPAPSQTLLYKKDGVTWADSGVACASACAPLACTSAHREADLAAQVSNDTPQSGLSLTTTQALLNPAGWTESVDQTGEFSPTASGNAVRYDASVAGNQVTVRLLCKFAGSRTTGGNNRSVTFQLGRSTAGADPGAGDGVGLPFTEVTANNGDPFSFVNDLVLVMDDQDTFGILLNGSTSMTINSYISACEVERLGATVASCDDTTSLRRCRCE